MPTEILDDLLIAKIDMSESIQSGTGVRGKIIQEAIDALRTVVENNTKIPDNMTREETERFILRRTNGLAKTCVDTFNNVNS